MSGPPPPGGLAPAQRGAPELPLACSLDAAGMERRGEEARALFEAALVRAERDGLRLTLRFRPGPEVAERVEALAVAERDCCSFLDLDVGHGDGATWLEITAPPGAGSVLDLFEQLAAAALRR